MLAGCATTPAPAGKPPGPAVTAIAVVARGWHTDICLRSEDAGEWVGALARGFDGARFLCFGFGDRRYVITHDHSWTAMFSAMFPGPGALLMTVLRDTPAAAFGAGDVVSLGVDEAGLRGLRGYLRDAVEKDGAGLPVRLGQGPYPGSLFFGATGSYDGLYTCNTWTADALRSAGLPVGGALFAGGIMRQARAAAAAQGRDAP
ncbi:DUF2459 domain-containing protein [Cupriavidus sp. 2TAF22]|uniref:DUF2459 domain-containing protein n=1 Tax=unclassified Cupriavidus TaxID=2640874 RepID=UPI003F8DAF78